jgi:hypothetical protein
VAQKWAAALTPSTRAFHVEVAAKKERARERAERRLRRLRSRRVKRRWSSLRLECGPVFGEVGADGRASKVYMLSAADVFCSLLDLKRQTLRGRRGSVDGDPLQQHLASISEEIEAMVKVTAAAWPSAPWARAYVENTVYVRSETLPLLTLTSRLQAILSTSRDDWRFASI